MYPVVGAAAAAVAVVLLLVAVLVACMCRRSRRRSKAAAAAAGLSASAHYGPPPPYWGPGHGYSDAHGSAHSAPAIGKAAYSLRVLEGGNRRGADTEPALGRIASLGAADGTVSTSADGTTAGGGRGHEATDGSLWTQQCINSTYGMHEDGGDVEPPPPGAPVERRLAWAHRQLDSFGPDDVVLGRFRLLGPNERRQGGARISLRMLNAPFHFSPTAHKSPWPLITVATSYCGH